MEHILEAIGQLGLGHHLSHHLHQQLTDRTVIEVRDQQINHLEVITHHELEEFLRFEL